jgi:hypothetical protein
LNNKRKISLTITYLLIFLTSLNGQETFPKFFDLFQNIDQNPYPPSNSVSQMLVQDSTIWIGTSKGLAKSTTMGRSWINYNDSPEFANEGIYALDIQGDTIWTSTGFSKEVGQEQIATGSGYTYSTNGGASWNHLGQSVDLRGDSIITNYGINDSIYMLPIVVQEQNVTYDISLSTGAIWTASWAGGLRKSTDNGTTWKRILLPLDRMNSIKLTDSLWTYAPSDTLKQHKIYYRFDPRPDNNLKAFSVLAIDNDTIWCGTAGGVNKSTDGGSTWQKFNYKNQDYPLLSNWVITIKKQSYQSEQIIWTTNWSTGETNDQNGISYTKDGGQTWVNLLHGVKAYDLAFKDSIVYIATEEGLYRTADFGQTYNKINLIVNLETRQFLKFSSVLTTEVIKDTVIVGTPDGIGFTIDNSENEFGDVWKIVQRYEPTSYASPNPFAPDGDIYTKIHYNMPREDANVTIDLFDFGMNRFRTLIQNAFRSAQNQHYYEPWDGKDDSGNFVGNGVYFYRIQVGNEDPIWGKVMILK